MSDTTRPLSGFDIDLDELAAELHALAQGIGTGDIHVVSVESGEEVESTEEVKQELTVRYVPTTEGETDTRFTYNE